MNVSFFTKTAKSRAAEMHLNVDVLRTNRTAAAAVVPAAMSISL